MKPENIMIRRQNIDVSFSQAITIDRLTGAATGEDPPFRHDLFLGENHTITVRVRKGPQRYDYVVKRNGDTLAAYRA